ncbi:MAG: MATE family efflux transporter [Lachnospiraceae bacterium]|jgi:putative MATE family efflux protein|nr:MATE family efflux transporter [Lachnospiraceae bacterium]
MGEKTLSGDFTQGSIAKKLIRFMVPILGALVLQAMYGAVDLLVVGQFGTNAGISAVSTGSNVINLVTFVISALTMGVTVLIGRYLGENKKERIGKVIGGTIAFFAVFALVLMVLLLIFAPQFASWLNAPEAAYDLTVTYIRICGGGILFVIAYNVISGIFRGLGNSKLPLIFVAIACAINIIGDLVFVALFHMDVAGAALATILAQLVSVVMSLVIIKRQSLPFHFRKKDIGFNSEIKNFVRTGFPIALQEVLTNLSFLILCAIINGISLEASSGYGIAQKVVSFVMLIPSSLMQSMSAFVAQNVGAGREDRAKKAMKTGMAFGVCIGVFVMLISYFRGDVPSALFTSNPDFIAKSAEYLRGFSAEAILTCIVFSYIGYFNGHGKTMPVMVQGISASFLFRVPLSYLFSIQPGANLVTIGAAVPLASVYGILFFSVCYLVFQKGLKKENSNREW